MGTTDKGLRYIDPTQPIARTAEFMRYLAEDVDDKLDTIGTGPAGPPGPAGGTDAATAGWIGSGPLTTAALDARAVRDYTRLLPFFAALDNRDTAKVDIAMIGPSTIEGFPNPVASSVPALVANRLRQRYPTVGLSPRQGGTGIIGVPSAPVRGTSGTPWTFTGGMQFDEATFNSGVTHTIFYTNGTQSGQLTTDRDLTSVAVRHVLGTAGHATAGYIQANSLSAVSFSTIAGAPANAVSTFTAAQLGFPAGIIPAGTILKVGCSGTGYLIGSGLEGYYNDSAKGIHVHNFGHSGADTAFWSVGGPTALTWQDIAAVNPDLVVLDFFGINAGSSGRTAAQHKTDLVAFVALIRAAGIASPILLCSSYDPTAGVALASPWADYVTAQREVAAADTTIAYLDHSRYMPATSVWPLYGYYQSDKVHMTVTGQERIADQIVGYLAGMNPRGVVGEALPKKADLVDGYVPQGQLAYHGLPLFDWTSGNQYESQYLGRGTPTTATPVVGVVNYDLVYVPNRVRVTSLIARAGGAAATQVYNLGLYANSSGNKPGAKLAGGTVAAPAAAAYSVAVDVVLEPGFYWIAFLATVASSTTYVIGGGGFVGYRGDTVTFPTAGGGPSIGYVQTGQASLPATATPVAASDTQQSRPRVALAIA